MWKWFSRSPDPPLAVSPLCYGKLPIYQDFLSLRGEGASQRFQEWLNGLDRSDGRPARIPHTQRLLLVSKEFRQYIVATVWDSSDARGIRKFPFALYFELPRLLLDSSSPRLLSAHQAWWAKLEETEPALLSVKTAEEFYQRLRETKISLGKNGGSAPPAVDPAPGPVPGIASQALAAAIYGPQPFDDWVRLLWRVHQAAPPGGGGPAFLDQLAMKLPLGEGIPPALQIEAWIKLARDRAGKSAPLPSILWPKDEPEGGRRPAPGRQQGFYLFFRELRAGDVFALQGLPAGGQLLDFTEKDPDMEVRGFSDFVDAAAAWLEKPEADLWNLLPPQGA
ncbi:MAG: DUF2094 domain-containing protein [Planctomycetes bacterium]|nr:DUF2094 domain-containing protein [Planctomycetota bacterium]